MGSRDILPFAVTRFDQRTCNLISLISDVELTRISGFLEKLKDKPGVSIMADKGFTIREMLKEINVDLNLPPFLNGKQLTADEVLKGRRIASLRIHVERAIRRIKEYHYYITRNDTYFTGEIDQSSRLCVCLFN